VIPVRCLAIKLWCVWLTMYIELEVEINDGLNYKDPKVAKC